MLRLKQKAKLNETTRRTTVISECKNRFTLSFTKIKPFHTKANSNIQSSKNFVKIKRICNHLNLVKYKKSINRNKDKEEKGELATFQNEGLMSIELQIKSPEFEHKFTE